MPSNVTTSQGQMWDQVALIRYGSERQMGDLLPANVDELDCLAFAGGLELEIPEAQPAALRSLPPWERM